MDLMARRRQLLMIPHGIIYEGFNLDFDGTNYIDTGAYLFTEENINKDFEVIADGIVGLKSNENAIICAKHNGKSCGFLVRTNPITSTTYNGTICVTATPNRASIIVRRENGVITVSGTNITNPRVKFINDVFDWPLVLGCAIDDAGGYYRYATGTIDHVLVKWT